MLHLLLLRYSLGVRFLQQHNVVLDWTRHKENRPVLRLPGEDNGTICTMATAGGETAGPTEAPDVPVLELAEVLTDLKYHRSGGVSRMGAVEGCKKDWKESADQEGEAVVLHQPSSPCLRTRRTVTLIGPLQIKMMMMTSISPAMNLRSTRYPC